MASTSFIHSPSDNKRAPYIVMGDSDGDYDDGFFDVELQMQPFQPSNLEKKATPQQIPPVHQDLPRNTSNPFSKQHNLPDGADLTRSKLAPLPASSSEEIGDHGDDPEAPLTTQIASTPFPKKSAQVSTKNSGSSQKSQKLLIFFTQFADSIINHLGLHNEQIPQEFVQQFDHFENTSNTNAHFLTPQSPNTTIKTTKSDLDHYADCENGKDNKISHKRPFVPKVTPKNDEKQQFTNTLLFRSKFGDIRHIAFLLAISMFILTLVLILKIYNHGSQMVMIDGTLNKIRRLSGFSFSKTITVICFIISLTVLIPIEFLSFMIIYAKYPLYSQFYPISNEIHAISITNQRHNKKMFVFYVCKTVISGLLLGLWFLSQCIFFKQSDHINMSDLSPAIYLFSTTHYFLFFTIFIFGMFYTLTAAYNAYFSYYRHRYAIYRGDFSQSNIQTNSSSPPSINNMAIIVPSADSKVQGNEGVNAEQTEEVEDSRPPTPKVLTQSPSYSQRNLNVMNNFNGYTEVDGDYM